MKAFRLAVAAALALFLAAGSPPSLAQDKAGKQDPSEKQDKAGKQDKRDKQDGKLSRRDRNALQRLAQADMAEIETGKVAGQKASNPEVKKFGERMVDDHGKMLEEGTKIAQAKGVKPPAGPDKRHQAALKKLEGLSGADFDRRYMDQMVRDHEQALKVAERAAKDAKDPEVKAHAEKGAPVIKEHLDMARKLQASVGGATAEKGKKASKKE